MGTDSIDERIRIIKDWKKECTKDKNYAMRRELNILYIDFIRAKAHEDMQQVITEAEEGAEMDPTFSEELKDLIKVAQETGLQPRLKEASEMWGKLDKEGLSGGSADISGDGTRKYRI